MTFIVFTQFLRTHFIFTVIDFASRLKLFDNGHAGKNEMLRNRVYLKTPSINELDYRIKLLADAKTMQYNVGYGDDGSGCYYLTHERAQRWYIKWLEESQNYYAYIVKIDGEYPVGDVSLHYDEAQQLHLVGVTIEASQRRNGYAKEALRLLIDKAFNEMKLERIGDTLPKGRTDAEQLFKTMGFKRVNENLLILTKVGIV